MRKILFLLSLFPVLLTAQVSFDFEERSMEGWDESEAGRWNLDSLNVINGNYSLHHSFDNPSSGHDQISTAITDLKPDQDTTTWCFSIRHSYSPSSANNWAVYLFADKNADEMYPSGTANGYILGVNFTGSDDLVKLWKISEGKVASVITTGFNWQERVPVDSVVHFRVIRTMDGSWSVEAGVGGVSENMTKIGSAKDEELVKANYFGIYYEYSSAQDRKLWLDDISISGPFIKDTIPPELVKMNVVSSNVLRLEFNEPLQDTSWVRLNNFIVDRGVGNPVYIENTGPGILYLTFEGNFMDETLHHLNVKNISDLSGNILIPARREFFWYIIKTYDVVINEIMADPVPSVELPEAEFIEIRNNTSYDLQMEGWKLVVGSKEKIIPTFNFPAEAYLILCAQADTSFFIPYGVVTGIPGMPTLNNDGQDLVLLDSSGGVMSFISYNRDWYQNDLKSEGGWSLEQIDPGVPCAGAENWQASDDPGGATPGKDNSVFASNPDFSGPELKSVIIRDNNRVEVLFNEPYNRLTAENPLLYEIDKSVGTPDSVELIASDYKKIMLSYSLPFRRNTIYTLMVGKNFTDCSGNKIGDYHSMSFGIPEKPEMKDVIINEVLFHPLPGGADYVEIFNRSDKILDAADLKIATRDDVSGELTSVLNLTNGAFLLLPHKFLVLTTNPGQVAAQYPFSDPSCFIKVEKLPVFPNKGGTVVLTDKGFNILDEFNYSEEMHFSLLQNVAGVSLERLNPDNFTMDGSNWHSAAEIVNFGTPGLKNSQYLEKSESSGPVWVDPEVFSPDNDGYRDVVQVFYEFNQPGYVANVTIFDSRGRRIRFLHDNEMLGTSGSFLWDGEDETGRKADIGIYVFFIEVFDLKGKVKVYKKTCVLAHKMN